MDFYHAQIVEGDLAMSSKVFQQHRPRADRRCAGSARADESEIDCRYLMASDEMGYRMGRLRVPASTKYREGSVDAALHK